MPQRDIVVIGGSSGCLEVLQQIVRGLPPDIAAAIFVIVHRASRWKSYLAETLNKLGTLPAKEASDKERIHLGQIYVAPPDHHLLLGEGHVLLSRGPKEGLQRPSINVSFRSAAATYGGRVIGVLLSGRLDDGAAGLWEIANHGGITIVQDPAEASQPSMPLSALQDASIDYSVQAKEIAPLLGRIISGKEQMQEREASLPEVEGKEFSGFTCPECRGPLYRIKKPGPLEFRCRVGHGMSLQVLLEEAAPTQERKLYEALVALEEGADLAEYAAGRLAGSDESSLRREAEQLREHTSMLKKLIEERRTP